MSDVVAPRSSVHPSSVEGKRKGKIKRNRSLTLLRRSTSSSCVSSERDDRGWTPLMVASSAGNLKQVDALLLAGSDVNEFSCGPKSLGATALHLAAKKGHVAVMDLLLEHGANIESRTKGGFGLTPLHLATRYNRKDAVRFLVENGAFLSSDRTDVRFNPPSHYFHMDFAYEVQRNMSADCLLLSEEENEGKKDRGDEKSGNDTSAPGQNGVSDDVKFEVNSRFKFGDKGGVKFGVENGVKFESIFEDLLENKNQVNGRVNKGLNLGVIDGAGGASTRLSTPSLLPPPLSPSSLLPLSPRSSSSLPIPTSLNGRVIV